MSFMETVSSMAVAGHEATRHYTFCRLCLVKIAVSCNSEEEYETLRNICQAKEEPHIYCELCFKDLERAYFLDKSKYKRNKKKIEDLRDGFQDDLRVKKSSIECLKEEFRGVRTREQLARDDRYRQFNFYLPAFRSAAGMIQKEIDDSIGPRYRVVDPPSRLERIVRTLEEEVESLESLNLLHDVFSIWFDGPLCTINGVKLNIDDNPNSMRDFEEHNALYCEGSVAIPYVFMDDFFEGYKRRQPTTLLPPQRKGHRRQFSGDDLEDDSNIRQLPFYWYDIAQEYVQPYGYLNSGLNDLFLLVYVVLRNYCRLMEPDSNSLFLELQEIVLSSASEDSDTFDGDDEEAKKARKKRKRKSRRKVKKNKNFFVLLENRGAADNNLVFNLMGSNRNQLLFEGKKYPFFLTKKGHISTLNKSFKLLVKLWIGVESWLGRNFQAIYRDGKHIPVSIVQNPAKKEFILFRYEREFLEFQYSHKKKEKNAYAFHKVMKLFMFNVKSSIAQMERLHLGRDK